MRKLSLLIVLFVALGLAAFAETIVEPTITGSATATIGYSLDNESFGIKNETSSSIAITLVDTASDSKGGEGVYGEIQLNDFGISMNTDALSEYDLMAQDEDDGDLTLIDIVSGDDDDFLGVQLPLTVTAPSITAKIMMAPLWIQIDSEPGVATADKVADVDTDPSSLDFADDVAGGLTIGLDVDPAAIQIKLATETDYTGTVKASDATIVVGLGLGLTAGPAAIDASFMAAVNEDDYTADTPMGFGAKVTLDVAPLTITAAVDGEMDTSAGTDIEAGGGLSFALGEGTSLGADASFLMPAGTDGDLDAKITFAESSGSGMVEPLGLNLSVTLSDITSSTLGWGVSTDFTFAATDQVTLKGDFGINSSDVVNAMVGVDLAMLANTTITLMWDGDDLQEKEAESDHDLGQVTCAIKIAY